MRWLLAFGLSLVVLVITWPATCQQGEFDQGSCKSAIGIPAIGTAETGDTWGILTSLVAGILVFVVALRLARRRS